MKKNLGIVVLIVLGVAALWWLSRPAADAPSAAKATKAPVELKPALNLSAPKPAQVEAPKASPAPASEIRLKSSVESAAPVSGLPPSVVPDAEVMNNMPLVTVDEKGMTTVDFGVVEMTDGVPMQWTLDDGQVWTITPKVSASGDGSVSMNIGMVKESDGKKSVANSRITALSGQNVSLSVGRLNIALTPNVKVN